MGTRLPTSAGFLEAQSACQRESGPKLSMLSASEVLSVQHGFLGITYFLRLLCQQTCPQQTEQKLTGIIEIRNRAHSTIESLNLIAETIFWGLAWFGTDTMLCAPVLLLALKASLRKATFTQFHILLSSEFGGWVGGRNLCKMVAEQSWSSFRSPFL